ncbi:hypothetical protein HUS85_23900 [Pseudomonas protegens]|uniref:hypothetical protein n=1 Tax=Pseudomonas protegens TaxID=380021 RepID=UPI001B301281|nr:hypothetical protein [Pseudomonas protegens]MBP5118893.1 hypothetical protein [Pseudomonas protegens]QTU20622.1 hypothetical protein HUT22_21640 [Pseudomonas protegens]
MDFDRNEAAAIRAELQRWHDEARSLINNASDKSRLSATSIESLKSRLVTLKAEIKEAAKHETISRRKAEKTDLERCYFGPAVRSTSANFRMRTDTSPCSELWSRGLFEVEMELSYKLHGIEKLLSDHS